MAEFVWKMSPSIIESYFAHGNCVRSLAATGFADDDPELFGFTPKDKTQSSVARAGDAWEPQVLEKIRREHGDDSVIQKPAETNADGRAVIPKFKENEFEEELCKLIRLGQNGEFKPPYYIYQAGLTVGESFFKKNIKAISGTQAEEAFKGDGKFRLIKDNNSYPDLIRAEWNDGKLLLSIVDIKLAKKPKIEHKMQIGMYIRLLEDFLERHQLDSECRVNREEGYLFNFGHEKEEPFDTKAVLRFLDGFFDAVIPEIIEKGKADIHDDQKIFEFPYHISQKCEWCPNYETCIRHCKDIGEEIMLFPYITPYAQDYIRKLKETDPDLKSLSVADLRQYLQNPMHDNKMNENSFWKRFLLDKEENLDMLEAACRERPTPPAKRSTASCEMPLSEDVRIILSAQKDAGFDRSYYWGIRVRQNREIPGLFDRIAESTEENDAFKVIRRSEPGVLEYGIFVKDMGKQREAEEKFISLWHALTGAVDDYNRTTVAGRGDSDDGQTSGITLQHYVMDNYELRNIEETLSEVLEDVSSPVWQSASDLMFILQGQCLVEQSEFPDRPGETIDYPVTILTTVVGQLFVLPAVISNSIGDVCGAFFGTGGDEKQMLTDLNDAGFVNKRSNVIKNEPANEYWETKKPEIPDTVLGYMSNRLKAEDRLIDRSRESGHRGIVGKPSMFLFPKKVTIANPELRRLYFEVLYEYKLSSQNIRRARLMDLNQALDESRVWLVRRTDDPVESYSGNDGKPYVKVKTILKSNPEGFHKDDLFSALLCEWNAENLEALPFFDENIPHPINAVKSRFPRIKYRFPRLEIVREGKNVFVNLYEKITEDLANQVYRPKTNFLLFEKISSINLKSNKNAIYEADVKHRDFFVTPSSFYGKLKNDWDAVKQQLIDYGKTGDGNNFTPSQLQALRQFYEKNVTLLLGPPGTGKTNFISRALISLIRLSSQKPLKVVVSANSHNAIENVLIQVCKMMNSIGSGTDDIIVGKLGRLDNDCSGMLVRPVLIEDNELTDLLQNDKPLIVGSTMWNLYKIHSNDPSDGLFDRFDVIVLDEASQVRMADAVIPLMMGGKESTRYLIVGDEDQLPPIIQGGYEKNTEKLYLLGSVFRYYFDCDRMRPHGVDSYVCQLDDNFRMNQAIAEYSAKMIYGDRYKPFKAAIGNQTLQEKIGSADDLKAVIESLYPGDTQEERNIIETILDPDYPLVLCCVGGDTADQIKKREVELVVKTVKTLQYALKAKKQKDGEEYSTGEFWGTSTTNSCGDFGIVSPHHEHITRLKNEILNNSVHTPFTDGETANDLFIGTVDKLQGQERETVVVSYGITDVERAISEKEFVFSRNRLNVAITRAKKKCIVFLTEAVLNYPIEGLEVEDQDLINGLDYVCSIREYMKSAGLNGNADKKTFAEVTVYRKGTD